MDIPKLPKDSVHQPTSSNPSPSKGLLKATHPNPKDPQAELRLKIADWVDDYAETLLGSEYSGKINREECLDGLLELFQAHQQELLSELLGELPEKELPEIEPGAMIIEHEGKLVKTEHLAKMRNTGFNQAIDQVVSVIERKIGELNG